jgi:hypothetical protein
MNRGLIIEKNKDHIKVMTHHAGVKKITFRDGCEVGEEIYYSREDLIMNNKRIKWNYIAAAAVFLLAIAAGGVGYAIQNTVYTVVSVDVNPSIQLELNKKDVVIGVEAMNLDGETVIELVDIEGETFEDALAMIVKQLQNDYEGETIYLTTVEKRNDDESIYEELDALINDEFTDYSIVYTEATVDDLKQADQKGVSVGIRKLERIQEEASENGETERTQASVKTYFREIMEGKTVEDMMNLSIDGEFKFNQTFMKQLKVYHKEAIEEHKDAVGDAQEDRKQDKEQINDGSEASDAVKDEAEADEAEADEAEADEAEAAGNAFGKDHNGQGTDAVTTP